MAFNPVKCELPQTNITEFSVLMAYSTQITLLREETQARYFDVSLKTKLIWFDHIVIL